MRRLLVPLVVIALATVIAVSSQAGARAPAPTTSGLCAEKSPAAPGPSTWPGAQSQLAPAGADSLTVCRYSGTNVHPPLSLVSAGFTRSSSVVGQVTTELDELGQFTGPVHCPEDDGSKIVAELSYPGGQQLTVDVGLTGCQNVTNGSVTRTAAPIGPHPSAGRQLIAALGRLAPAAPPSGPVPTPRPPSPILTSLGITRTATLGSYCWQVTSAGGSATGTCVDAILVPPQTTLGWRARAPIVIDFQLPAHHVRVQAAHVGSVGGTPTDLNPATAHRDGHAGRRWIVKLPSSAAVDNVLLFSADFAQGDLAAEIGIRPRR